MKSYVLTNSRLKKKESVIAMGSHQGESRGGGGGEGLISAFAVPFRGGPVRSQQNK